MKDFSINKKLIADEGFTIIERIFTNEEIAAIVIRLENVDTSNEKFRKTADFFAIRQFLAEVPVIDLIFNENLKIIIREIFGSNYFLVKSIYFDKPEQSNWFVSYHHDLTISVDRKVELENFGPWTTKQNQFAVQPPVEFLENIFTIRIHLDDTDEKNGALKILPGSHANGICRIENRNKTIHEQICKVNSGGIMIMKPLLFHSSSRSSSNKKRRVIHLEFCGLHLPAEINWAEKMELI